jgi:hypothetical protein
MSRVWRLRNLDGAVYCCTAALLYAYINVMSSNQPLPSFHCLLCDRVHIYSSQVAFLAIAECFKMEETLCCLVFGTRGRGVVLLCQDGGDIIPCSIKDRGVDTNISCWHETSCRPGIVRLWRMGAAKDLLGLD